MNDYIVTYDLKENNPDPHAVFLKCARGNGFLYVFFGNTYVSRLPNTTLWGVFSTREKAFAAFQKTVDDTTKALGVQVVVRKRFLATFNDWSVASDVKKKPDAKLTGASRFETSANHQDRDPLFK